MTRRSLRLRLAIAGAGSIAFALILAFFGLSFLFERHVERRVVGEISVYLDQVIAGLGRQGSGKLDVVRPPADPRFDRPFSGIYWQIETEGIQRLSRSLWDTALVVPPWTGTGIHQAYISGPGNADLIVVTRRVVTDPGLGNVPVLAIVAADRSIARQATLAFRNESFPYLVLLALLLLGASTAQIIIGTRPLDDLRQRIALIRAGSAKRLGSGFPDEVQPLTAEVDGLLELQEQQLRRAQERAAELAHGFKTPLQVLSGDVVRLKALGHQDLAVEIDNIIIAMRRLVDHEITRARIAGKRHYAASSVSQVISSVISVVQRTPRGQKIDWRLEVNDDLKARIDPDDFAEVIGNILENAARYAGSEVLIRARANDQSIELEIIDDGPGIPEKELPFVLRRGARLDTTSGGAGLGLSIVENILQTTGGEIELENLPQGLKVTILLPRSTLQ